jgi:YD repeat-containing protein
MSSRFQPMLRYPRGQGISSSPTVVFLVVLTAAPSTALTATCQYQGKTYDCEYPVKGKWQGVFDTVLGRKTGPDLERDDQIISVLQNVTLQDHATKMALYSSYPKCSGTDGAPLSRLVFYRNGPGDSGGKFNHSTDRGYYFGETVVWAWSSCDKEVTYYPTVGALSGRALYSRTDVCRPGFVTYNWTYKPNVGIEDVDYALCYYNPVVDNNPTTPPPRSCEKGSPGFSNPIYPLTGSKQQKESLGWMGSWGLSIDYDTRGKVPGATFSVAGAPSFGLLWQSSLHKRLVLQRSSAGVLQAVQASRGSGGWVSFMLNSSGGFQPHAGIADRLVSASGGWRYWDATAQALEIYDAAGVLTAVHPASGGSWTYTYSAATTPAEVAPSPGLLLAVQDQFGRSLQFTYEAGPAEARVKGIVDANGGLTSVGYDPANNLTSLLWPDGGVRSFVYENAGLPWALTGKFDENSSRNGTYGYDAQGRAVSSERGGGVDRYTVSYGMAPAIAVSDSSDTGAGLVRRQHAWLLPQGVTVNTPNNQSLSLGATLVNGMPLLATRSQPAGAGCDASSSSLGYDANGNVASRTDFNGNRSCHAHDPARNLETARLEGLGSTEACPADVAAQAIAAGASQRKTTTEWHPQWSLPARRAEPGKITTFVYNNRPGPDGSIVTCAPATATLPDGSRIAVLCRKVEQATTDATGTLGFNATPAGTARSWTYTYNEFGQVLTVRDPLNHLTTYAYYGGTTAEYTRGDLQSITNAANQATQYTHYARSGRLLRSVDANGTVTSTTYTPRGWVRTTTVTPLGGTPQATTYDHDGVGQLKKATLPDGTTLEYTYDAAHRLTGVKDAAGNAVAYTLDNMGNRTGEALKDASGTLARNITRVYDALNRVQSATGAAQ